MAKLNRIADVICCPFTQQEKNMATRNRIRNLLTLSTVITLGLSTSQSFATLVGYWDFDHTSGTTLSDKSGNAYSGTLEGATLPTWTTGFTGLAGDGALSFTAAGQAGSVKASTDTAPNVGSSRVDLGLTPGLKLLGNETISMWLRPNASSVRQNVFGISYSGAGAIVLENVDAATQVNNGFNFYYGSGGDNSGAHNNGVDSTPITRDGSTWTHVVYRRDGGGDDLQPWTSSILFNGVDVTTVGGASPFTGNDPNEVVADTPGTKVYLGAGYVTSFDGLIDDTAMWDRALSDGESIALYDARANTANPFYLEDLNVADLEEIFQVHLDAGATETKIGDYTYQYSADIGTMFPSVVLGEAELVGGQIVLLLDVSGTGVLGLPPVPEPSSFLLIGMGMVGLAARRRRQRLAAQCPSDLETQVHAIQENQNQESKLPATLSCLAVAFLALLSLPASSSATMVSLNADRDGLMLADPDNPYDDANFGGTAFFQTGRSLGDPTRSLVGFDTTPLVGLFQPGDVVDSITLRLFTTSNTTGTSAKTTQVFAVADANADWVEGTASATIQNGSFSWNSRQHGTSTWVGSGGLSTAGVDYDSTLLAQQNFASNPAADTMVDFGFTASSATMTSLINTWLNASNAGLLLFDPNENTLTDNIDRLTYHSMEAGTASFRPTLIVEFSTPEVPEPSSFLLLGLGTMGLVRHTRRRRRSA